LYDPAPDRVRLRSSRGAEAIDKGWYTPRGTEGSSPKGAFPHGLVSYRCFPSRVGLLEVLSLAGWSPTGALPHWLGSETASILLDVAPQVGVLVPQDRNIKAAVDGVILALILEASGQGQRSIASSQVQILWENCFNLELSGDKVHCTNA